MADPSHEPKVPAAITPAATAPAGLADRVVSRVNSELESRFLANLTAEQRADLPANAIPQINLNTSNLNANAQVRSDDTDGDFAYKAMAGVAFPIRAVPGLAVTAEYRFFGTLQPELNAMSKQGRWQEMATLIDDEMLHTIAACGSPADVAAHIRDRVAGVSDRICLYQPGPIAVDSLAEIVDALAT